MEISATQAKMAGMDENEQCEAMLCQFPLLTPANTWCGITWKIYVQARK